jgi:V/A-type H+/Na+-transporting ATPase subunit I
MNKVTILVSEKEREKFVSSLRALGLLHVSHTRHPASHEISFTEDRVSRIEKLIEEVSPYDIGRPDRRKFCKDRDVLSCEEAVSEDLKTKLELENRVEALKKDALWYEEWGKFDPEDLKAARDAGVNIRFYRVPASEAKTLDPKKAYIAGRKSGTLLCALITSGGSDELEYEEVSQPGQSPEEISETIDDAREEIQKIEERMKDRARGLVSIKERKEALEKELAALRVRFGMQGEGAFAYVQGYCPMKRAGKIKAFAERHSLGYVLEKPDNVQEAPTLVTNPKWVEIVNPVFKFMNTLPGYDEFDISLPFLGFFSLFFAMLIGDAGYGTLFLVITFLARKKFRKAPAQPFFLMYLLSVSTILWGAVTGTWFGAEGAQNIPIINNMIIPGLNSFSDTNQNFIMLLCFTIGAVHLSLARLMKITREFNSLKALADAGWILIVWGMFFAAKKFVLGDVFPPAAGWMLGAGGALALVFSAPEQGILKGIGATMINLPLSIIGSFSDVISYIRLFAVGMATVVVAKSFNDMALAGGAGGVAGGLIAALILFFGHALNIALGFMAVIVHGVRLNMLEFSGHLGMQWSGKPYDPFK